MELFLLNANCYVTKWLGDGSISNSEERYCGYRNNVKKLNSKLFMFDSEARTRMENLLALWLLVLETVLRNIGSNIDSSKPIASDKSPRLCQGFSFLNGECNDSLFRIR